MAPSGTHGGSRPGNGSADGACYAMRCGASDSGERLGWVIGCREHARAWLTTMAWLFNATRLQCTVRLPRLMLTVAGEARLYVHYECHTTNRAMGVCTSSLL